MADYNKLTIIYNPIDHIKFWWQLHNLCVRVCGDWFGVALYPNGKIIFKNDEFLDFVMSRMTPKKERSDGRD